LRTLEKNLRQAAENAVASAVSSQLNPAINQAITAIDKLSQVTARQIEEHGSRCKSMLIHSAQDELRSQLQADLTQSEEQLRKQLGMALNEIQETSQTLQNNATSEGHLVLAESVDFLKLASTELQRQYTDQLRETTDRASARRRSGFPTASLPCSPNSPSPP
jgi:transketolase